MQAQARGSPERGGAAGELRSVAPPVAGTGSNPPSKKGLQRKMRQAARSEPRQSPWVCTAVRCTGCTKDGTDRRAAEPSDQPLVAANGPHQGVCQHHRCLGVWTGRAGAVGGCGRSEEERSRARRALPRRVEGRGGQPLLRCCGQSTPRPRLSTPARGGGARGARPLGATASRGFSPPHFPPSC